MIAISNLISTTKTVNSKFPCNFYTCLLLTTTFFFRIESSKHYVSLCSIYHDLFINPSKIKPNHLIAYYPTPEKQHNSLNSNTYIHYNVQVAVTFSEEEIQRSINKRRKNHQRKNICQKMISLRVR